MICSQLFTSLLHHSLTLVSRCLSGPPEKAADSLWTDDKVLQGRVQSWGLLCCSESRGLTVGPPFFVASSWRWPSLKGQGPAPAPAPLLRAEHGIKLLPQVG